MAHVVWDFFGDVPNYVEPFYGSGAVLLGRPHSARCETVNDLDCYVANFWRAVQQAPDEVAHWSDWPVNEADLHSRHRWLVDQYSVGFREAMRSDPRYYDAQLAGWWVWGISQWIGSGWCAKPEWQGRALVGRSARGIHAAGMKQSRGSKSRMGQWKTRPFLSAPNGNGITVVGTGPKARLPDLGGNSGAFGKGVVSSGKVLGLWQKRPSFKRGYGSGVHRMNLLPEKRPILNRGAGVRRPSLSQQIPNLSGDSGAVGRGVLSKSISSNLQNYMMTLHDRLRRVRVCCGDWKRVLGPSPTTCIGTTAIFLDPPYSASAGRDPSIYNEENLEVAHEVREWAIANGNNPALRIALCGYAGEHAMPRGWTEVPWKANGGYGNQTKGRGGANANRERVWFSPFCLKVDQRAEVRP